MTKPIKLIKGPQAGTMLFADANVGWAFCSKPNAANESTIVTPLGYCRESLTTFMYNHMSPECQTGHEEIYSGIDKSKLRLVARIILNSTHTLTKRENQVEKFFRGLSTGVKILNILEERNGWILTKLHDVVHEIDPMLVVKMLVGSSRWLKTAHMLSLFCLLIRVATRDPSTFSEKKIEKFEDVDKAMSLYGRDQSNNYGLDDRGYIHKVWPYVDTIMKEYRFLFKGTLIKSSWKISGAAGYRHEGIYKLVSGTSSDKKISNRFEELKKKTYCN